MKNVRIKITNQDKKKVFDHQGSGKKGADQTKGVNNATLGYQTPEGLHKRCCPPPTTTI